MLDVHAALTTPGAAAVLGVQGAIAANDGATVYGVPISDGATLIMWGALSVAADGIGRVQLKSQDQIDPINGVDINVVAGVAAGIALYENLPYKSGSRVILYGTSTGVTAGSVFTIDAYSGHGTTVMGSRCMPNQVAPLTTTFGGALTANAWGTQAFAPATPLPNGKYAILGAFIGAETTVAALRFQHADFHGLSPGFPVVNTAISTLSPNSSAWTEVGYQFVEMGKATGIPCCPVFTVGPSGTGLNIQAICPTATTPTVNLLLAKVG